MPIICEFLGILYKRLIRGGNSESCRQRENNHGLHPASGKECS
jgi:hypothetical protein